MCNILTKVNVFNRVYMQGEYVESCHVERPHQPTALRWHPTKPLLAIGWETGEVVLLTHPSGDQTVIPSTHTACMLLLDWSSSGSRLVTGDQVCCSDDFTNIVACTCDDLGACDIFENMSIEFMSCFFKLN